VTLQHFWRLVAALLVVSIGLAGCSMPVPDPRPATPQPGSTASTSASQFVLQSPVMADGGSLPIEFTCDGRALSPPLTWHGAPSGTASYAVVMHHVASPSDVHWYLVLYNLAPTIDHIDAGAPPPGTVGTNSVNNRMEYTPPCSQGPGKKSYTLTVYALSRQLDLPDPKRVSRPVLLRAMDGLALGEATMTVTYERAGLQGGGGRLPGPADQRGRP
jgi:phosphatidylethanolamine-binding protein (PEBP) family uncharacterized protein